MYYLITANTHHIHISTSALSFFRPEVSYNILTKEKFVDAKHYDK